MERLTKRNPDNGWAYYPKYEPADIPTGHKQSVLDLVNRLAAYEDTGLSPEEVALYVKCQAESVSRRELQLGREVERLHVQLADAQRREQAMVEVVRCKECKHADPLYASNSPKQIGYICQYTDEKMLETDFCSYGEAHKRTRKEKVMPDLMRCGGERKFIVLPIKYFKRLRPALRGRVTLAAKEIEGMRMLEKQTKVAPEYIVINTDEPYVQEIIEILQRNGHWG